MHMTTYQQAVRVLQPVIEPTYEALRDGLKQASTDHAERAFVRKHDPHYYLHTVRRVAVQKLQGKGLQAVLENSDKRGWRCLAS
jgi:hypothetical protein